MENKLLWQAIEKLSEDFRNIHWEYLKVPAGSSREKTQLWPGEETEDVMICVAKGSDTMERFHRQDFFFFNFAYRGDYAAISYQFDNRVVIHEGECYIGQPYAGYAIEGDVNNDKQLIIGVLIQTNAFFKTFLSVLSSNAALFHFFLEPQIREFSDEFIQLRFAPSSPIRPLLEMMVVEYANKREDTQNILKPLTLALFMLVARQYDAEHQTPTAGKLSDRIVQYISAHPDTASLKELASHFSYHPNYISALLRKEIGRSFSEILIEQRMERAVSLMRGTTLSIEEIAAMLGYSNSSNFYKAFRSFYHISPREYAVMRDRREDLG